MCVLFILQAERPSLLRKRLQNSNRDIGLQGCYSHHPLIYGCETWIAYRRHVKVLEQFQQRILRAIIGVHWQDRITTARILEQADTTSIEAHIVRPQLSWAGHVRRMPDTPSTETATVRLAFIREAENWRTVATLQRTTESQPEEVWDRPPMGNHSRRPSSLAMHVHRAWELQTLSGDESPRRQRRESGEITDNMTTTLQTVQYVGEGRLIRAPPYDGPPRFWETQHCFSKID